MPTKKDIQYTLNCCLGIIPEHLFSKLIDFEGQEHLSPYERKQKFLAYADELDHIRFLHEVIQVHVKMSTHFAMNYGKCKTQLAELQAVVRSGCPKPKIMKHSAMEEYKVVNQADDDSDESDESDS